MMNTGGKNELMSEINVTPLVDVMLVLLIIFMVTAPMMIQGVDVSLPEAASGPLSSDQEHLILSIDKDSRIYINDTAVTFDGFRGKLAKILEGRTDREVFLKADKQVPYGTVVQLMSEAKMAGIEKLGMITEPLDEKKR